MNKIVGIFLLLLLLTACNSEKTVTPEPNIATTEQKQENKVPEEKSQEPKDEKKGETKTIEKKKVMTVEDKKNQEALEKIQKIVEENTKKMGTGLPKMRPIPAEKKKIIEQIETKTGIIDSISLEAINSKMISFSETIYNNDRSLGIYQLCTLLGNEDENNIEEKSWTEREYCGIIEYDVKNKKNTVIFLGNGGWNGGMNFTPSFRYNYKNDIIFGNDILYPREYLSNIIDNDTAHNLSLDRNDVNIHSSGPDLDNVILQGYRLDGSYISVACYLGCGVGYEKDITYKNKKTYMPSERITQDISIPYYNLKEDWKNLKNSEEYKKYKNDIDTGVDENHIKYIDGLPKDKFTINLSFEKADPTLAGEEYNKNNYYTWSGNIFKIQGVNPKEIQFDFHTEKNIEHPYLRAISISSKPYNGLFIYNMNNATFYWFENNGRFEGWKSDTELLINGKTISVDTSKFTNAPIELGTK